MPALGFFEIADLDFFEIAVLDFPLIRETDFGVRMVSSGLLIPESPFTSILAFFLFDFFCSFSLEVDDTTSSTCLLACRPIKS